MAEELHPDQDVVGDLPPAETGCIKAYSLELHMRPPRLELRHFVKGAVRWRDNRPTFDAGPWLPLLCSRLP